MAKDIPLALLVGLVIQAAGIVWWAQGVQKTQAEHEKRWATLDAQRIAERLASMESQMMSSQVSLQRIEAKLDRVIEKSHH